MKTIKSLQDIAKAYDQFMYDYYFYDWNAAQGAYTLEDIASNIQTDPAGEIDTLQEFLKNFEPGDPGYQECISIINGIKNLGGTTMKKVNDGWHKICGHDLYIENGYVIRGMAAAGIGYVSTHPFIKSRYGGWDNASGDLTIQAFRARVKRNSVIMA